MSEPEGKWAITYRRCWQPVKQRPVTGTRGNRGNRGDRERARGYFRAVLDRDPNHLGALLWSAWLAETGEKRAAYLNRARQVAPTNPRVQAALRWAAETDSPDDVSHTKAGGVLRRPPVLAAALMILLLLILASVGSASPGLPRPIASHISYAPQTTKVRRT